MASSAQRKRLRRGTDRAGLSRGAVDEIPAHACICAVGETAGASAERSRVASARRTSCCISLEFAAWIDDDLGPGAVALHRRPPNLQPVAPTGRG